ncbi:MAG: response regulator [Nitrospirota bacterium]
MKRKILIIDDDEKHILTTREILENEGYEVYEHNLGFGSTNIIKEIQPDLVLLDMNMPGLSGEKLAALLKESRYVKGVPIVFYSSNDEQSLREAVRKTGIQGYICKGDMISLRDRVNFYLAQIA